MKTPFTEVKHRRVGDSTLGTVLKTTPISLTRARPYNARKFETLHEFACPSLRIGRYEIEPQRLVFYRVQTSLTTLLWKGMEK